MHFHQAKAGIFIPDDQAEALARVTHLGIGAHCADDSNQVIFGLDLTPLIADVSLDIVEYVLGFVQRFEKDVRFKLQNRLN